MKVKGLKPKSNCETGPEIVFDSQLDHEAWSMPHQ